LPIRIADDLLAGREYFFDHFTAPDTHFFCRCRCTTQLEADISGFPNVTAHFKRMQEHPSWFSPQPNSSWPSGYSNLWAQRMKGKFDFARALVFVAFLPSDLDRGKPGPSSVDEIHTDRG
jgi:hypothetical protein